MIFCILLQEKHYGLLIQISHVLLEKQDLLEEGEKKKQ